MRPKLISKVENFGLPKMLFLFMAFIATMPSFAQVAGEYRSVTTGDWTALTTWQRFNGTTWVTPTTAQGWPGQLTGITYDAVTVSSGHVVTISNTGITTQPFKSLNIKPTGRLYLSGRINTTVTFSLATTIVNIDAGGDIYFLDKTKLVLLTDAAVVMQINLNGLVASTCNNNAELWVGNQKFAVCAGAPGDIFTFS